MSSLWLIVTTTCTVTCTVAWFLAHHLIDTIRILFLRIDERVVERKIGIFAGMKKTEVEKLVEEAGLQSRFDHETTEKLETFAS